MATGSAVIINNLQLQSAEHTQLLTLGLTFSEYEPGAATSFFLFLTLVSESLSHDATAKIQGCDFITAAQFQLGLN